MSKEDKWLGHCFDGAFITLLGEEEMRKKYIIQEVLRKTKEANSCQMLRQIIQPELEGRSMCTCLASSRVFRPRRCNTGSWARPTGETCLQCVCGY